MQKDIDRIVAIWRDCRAHAGARGNRGGPLLFGEFGVADAMFAPVVTRFVTYATALPPAAQAYADAVLGLFAVRSWLEEARRETAFVRADEPYA